MTAAVLDYTYWDDRLEVGADLVSEQHADRNHVANWLAGLSPRCRDILVGQFRIDAHQGVGKIRAVILEHHPALLPFMLVDAATAGKRTHAIVEVARAKLTQSQLEHCRVGEAEAQCDRNALMWLLYLQSPANLELVFHLDRIQRKGFARMVLASPPALSGYVRTHVSALLSRSFLQQLLDAFESENRTHRQSHCSEILHDGVNYKVFIKRDHRPTFIARGPKNTFGFEPEWIVLDFEPDLWRVHICSVSPDTPLLLANQIARAHFGMPVTYVNEVLATPAEKVVGFLGSLLTAPEKLPLVEILAKNSGLHGAPQLRLNDPENESLAPALQQFAAAFGNPLDALRDIESIKVYAFRKRVKVIFEAIDDGDAFIVRYADQPLNTSERRAFERMMERDHGLTVLSTEKKYAR